MFGKNVKHRANDASNDVIAHPYPYQPDQTMTDGGDRHRHVQPYFHVFQEFTNSLIARHANLALQSQSEFLRTQICSTEVKCKR